MRRGSLPVHEHAVTLHAVILHTDEVLHAVHDVPGRRAWPPAPQPHARPPPPPSTPRPSFPATLASAHTPGRISRPPSPLPPPPTPPTHTHPPPFPRSYVDLPAVKPHVLPAHRTDYYFASHAWGRPFREMVGLVSRYLRGAVASDVYVWVDIFIINQAGLGFRGFGGLRGLQRPKSATGAFAAAAPLAVVQARGQRATHWHAWNAPTHLTTCWRR